MANEVLITDLSSLVDEYVETRAQRIALEHQAGEFKKLENKQKEAIEATLKLANLATGGSKTYRATVVPDLKPTATDWGLVYAYITAQGAWDIVQRRLTETAVKARWDEGVTIPGITKFPITKLSITKVK